jgi:hypothetical protein
MVPIHPPPPATQTNSIIVSSRKAGRDAEAERKRIVQFQLVLYPYCVKQTVWHKMLIEITRA